MSERVQVNIENDGKKDCWDKLKVLAIVCIAPAVAFFGHSYTNATKQKEIDAKYVEFAIEVIKTKNSEASIRDWATQVIDKLSPVKLSPNAIEDFKIDWLSPEENMALIHDYKFNLITTDSHLAVSQNITRKDIDRIVFLSTTNDCRLETSLGNSKSTVFTTNEMPLSSGYFEQLEIPLFPLPLVRACLGLPANLTLTAIMPNPSSDDVTELTQDEVLVDVTLAIVTSEGTTAGTLMKSSKLEYK
ncbi:hypothetical protein [Vibrio owensii]|uniref:hypothetical protein n=1 Tax=Vibrio owensii TaxID=696485 RepID=UPI0018F26A92|nr:hypothetical protein [Vibrio owensii]